MEGMTENSSFIKSLLNLIRGNSKSQEVKATRIEANKYRMTKPTERDYDGSDLF